MYWRALALLFLVGVVVCLVSGARGATERAVIRDKPEGQAGGTVTPVRTRQQKLHITMMRASGGGESWRGRTASVRAMLVLLTCVLLLYAVPPSRAGDSNSDVQALVAFKAAVDPNNNLENWGGTNGACSWTGITCSDNRVWKIRLPGRGLSGTIPVGTLGHLDQLRVISLRSNRLSGPLPSDLTGLTLVQQFYFHNNQFSGALPSNFTFWPRLVHINFADNQFTGNIPSTLAQLNVATSILFQDNLLSGVIPDINPPSLQDFSVANNNLSGTVPPSLRRFPANSFSGNPDICGPPTNVSCPPSAAPISPPSSAPEPSGPLPTAARSHKKSNKLSTGAIVGIALGGAAFLLLLLLLATLCLLCIRKRRGAARAAGSKSKAAKGGTGGEAGASKAEESNNGYSSSMPEPERSKLVFFEGKRFTFDLEDLLRASAEVLGKGSVGTAYKAALEDGAVVAVKRLKDVTTSKKDFEQQIEAVGRMQHRNLVSLRAYYFSRDEKLLVYDYMPAGSLSALLHGTKGGSRTPLDWISRVRIAMGAARGLAFLHGEHNFTHGNIKSSNVLLTPELEGCLSDFGLAQLLMSSGGAASSRIIGYRAPEVVETRKVTPKADVYSFGVLLLELLTGKAPTQATLNDEGIDLPRWVQSVVREEWTAEVFDLELMRYQNIEEEMVQMLQVAMQCVAQEPDQRPSMNQVVKLLEDVRQFSDSGNDNGDETSKDTSAEKSKEDIDAPSIVEHPAEEARP